MQRKRLIAVARKEAIQLRRDRRSLALAFLLPVLLLILFGTAITWDVDDIPIAVVDQDGGQASRALVEAFTASGRFRAVAWPADLSGAERLLARGEARLVLVLPRGLAAELGGGEPVAIQAILDGSDANTAEIAIGYAQAALAAYAERRGGAAATPPILAASRVWYNEELSSRNMIVPGLVAVIMMIIAAMLTALTIAREWERGTLEQLAATPVTRGEIVLGKLLPYLIIGLVDVALITALGIALFGVPLRGSVALLAVLTTAFLVGSLGLGLFISAVTKSQLLATQVSMIATFLPALLLSGFMYAISVMPAPLQAISYLIPARYFLVVTRGIFLKGVGAAVLYPQGLLMIAFGALGVFAAMRAFRKELE